jgi:hypothetical protein
VAALIVVPWLGIFSIRETERTKECAEYLARAAHDVRKESDGNSMDHLIDLWLDIRVVYICRKMNVDFQRHVPENQMETFRIPCPTPRKKQLRKGGATS